MLAKCPASRFRLFRPSEISSKVARDFSVSRLLANLIEMSHGKVPASKEEIGELLAPGLWKNLKELFLGTSSELLYEEWKRSEGLFGNVIVYGDYDVDGICSTVLAMEVFLSLGRSVRFFIPHRHNDGYGVKPDIVEKLVRSGCDTFIILDTGTGSDEIVSSLSKRGINVFVFDHHVPQDPSITSWIVNPQIDGNSPAKDLCATAVFWTWAFKNRIMPEEWLFERLDLVALATLADCMHLGPLNRSLVNEGLKFIRGKTRPGLAELVRRMDLCPEFLTENDLVMKVIPSLNAPGRLETADPGVMLLASREGYSNYIDSILDINLRRRENSSSIAQEILSRPETDKDHVFYSRDWHAGVISGVASQVCSIKNKPVILAAPATDSIRGTIRVPDGASALNILENVSGYLERWGGHSFAAGFSISPKNWDPFRDRIEEIIAEIEIEQEEITALEQDPREIDIDAFYEISQLGPFGKGNPMPRFFKRRDGSETIVPLGRTGEHFKVSSGYGEFLAFNSLNLWKDSDDILGWIYYPSLNYWRGSLRVQLILDKILVP